MIYPSRDEMEQHSDSKYSLVVAVSKRAKQLREGEPKLIETKSTNPITIALEEIAAGKLKIVKPSLEELEAQQKAHADARNTTARLGIPTLADLDEEEELIIDEVALEEAEAEAEETEELFPLTIIDEDEVDKTDASDDDEDAVDTGLLDEEHDDADAV